MNRLIIPADIRHRVEALLAASAPAEEGCFCLLRSGEGVEGVRLLLGDVFEPPDDAWDDQRPDRLTPSARWLSEVISAANAHQCGLLFIHSHPDPRFPAGFSTFDGVALRSLGPVMGQLLDGPFAAAVVHPQGWIAAQVDGATLVSVPRVQAIGRTLIPLDPPETTSDEIDPLDARQAGALGVAHRTLRGLHVGLVGSGGLGSPSAEVFARMGVTRVTVMDPDRLDTPSNARRVFGSTAADLRATEPPFKVDVVGRHLDGIDLGTTVARRPLDVRTERACRELLDCDVVVCTTDSHSSRSVLNDLAYAYGLPVLDVGVRAGSRANALAALAAEVRVLTPTTPCLWCRDVLSADVIREELMLPERREQLEREGYLVGGPHGPEPTVVPLTVLGAGLVTCALLTLVSPDGADAPAGYLVDGFLGDARTVGPPEAKPDCICRTLCWQADHALLSWLPEPSASAAA